MTVANGREAAEFDYVVVGSGAGGGPLAANLARAGHRVLLLEAGGDEEDAPYQVPAFHGLATEDPALSWAYFVRHYESLERQRRDSKFTAERDGVLYPRAGTLGGCTAHNAMITVVPHDRDWDEIAAATGDRSWRSHAMRTYFERLERCEYVERPSEPPRNVFAWLARLARTVFGGRPNPGRHGFDGWLPTNEADPRLGLKDAQLIDVLLATVKVALAENVGQPVARLLAGFDPNDARLARRSPEGVTLTPLATHGGRRASTRDVIHAVEREHPERLTVRTHTLVTRVLLDAERRAIGVEVLEGAHLYRADPSANGAVTPVPRTIRVRREVILAAGAFNSPQLLMLSGIGPRDELARHGIPVAVELPGVGANLQDRYEVGVITEVNDDFTLLKGLAFAPPRPGEPPDPAFIEWQSGKGVYTSNGVVIGLVKKSTRDKPLPDLYIFGLPGFFRGYFPGYSAQLERHKNLFTWAVLKAHTRNTAGRVRLRSADPRDVPEINFRYFDEGNDAAREDLAAVVEGVEFVRRMMKRAALVTRREVVPGPAVDTREKLEAFIRDEAWGHHASCTNKMGPRKDPMAVVDSRFRVHGTKGLRVVDASVFPRIPGFFIVTAVYMISEKASEVILADSGDAKRPKMRAPSHLGG